MRIASSLGGLRWWILSIIAPVLLGSQPVAAQALPPGSGNNTIQSLYNLCETSVLKPTAAGMPDPCQAVLQQEAYFAKQDIQHLAVVTDFLLKHPNPHLLQLLVSNPKPSDTVQLMPDGSWSITVPVANPCAATLTSSAADGSCTPQTSQTVITMPFSGKLSAIYNSVVFAGDRNAQLNLYTDAYNKLAAATCLSAAGAPTNCDFGQLPLPSSLTTASIATIGTALQALASTFPNVLQSHFPIAQPPSTADCDDEIGGTLQESIYGDRTYNSASCTASATGLYGSLSDVQFPARAYLTCVKAQGKIRDTCHAFADTSAVEMMISEGEGVKVNLSEQDLMEHYRLQWSPGYMHETGDAYEELNDAIAKNYSFALESSWDYNPSIDRTFVNGVYQNSCTTYPDTEPGCSDSAPQAPGYCISFVGLPICALHEAGVPRSAYRPTSVTNLWTASEPELSKEYMILYVTFNNAVVLGFTVTDRFKAGGNGGYVVYDANDVKTNNGGHYVHVVGVAPNSELPSGAPPAAGGGYFIVKNSWNNCFGDAGYLYLDWDYVKAVGTNAFSVGASSN
jgi:C1A family cysteine protease